MLLCISCEMSNFSNEYIESLDDNRTDWFCEMCLSNALLFNHIIDDTDFIAALFELSFTTADSLRYLCDKIFHSFEINIGDHQVFAAIDPYVNFINSLSLYQNSCEYHLESSFNDLLRKRGPCKIGFTLCHLNISSMKKK